MERLTPLPWQHELWSQLVGWRERLPHALLLHGGRGIGKRHLMKAFAQLLLCEAPVDAAPCGRCAGCQLLVADNHPDLRWLTPAASMPDRDDAEVNDDGAQADRPEARSSRTGKPSREIVIDQVRKTSDFLSLSSHRGGRRVVLLFPAEALNPPAANALLKMLEEPPPGAVFLAVSDQLDAVLPTILSRCVLLRAPIPSPAQALQWLRSVGVDRAEAKTGRSGRRTARYHRGACARSTPDARAGTARGADQVVKSRRGIDRRSDRQHDTERHCCGAGDPSVTAVGMGLISRKAGGTRSLLSAVPAPVCDAFACDRAVTGGGLGGGTGANASGQRSSAERTLGR